MPLIDFHTHLPIREEMKSKLLFSMDSLLIEKSVVVAGGVLSCQTLSRQMNYGGGQDVTPPNLDLLEFCQREDRLLPFYFANPHSDCREYESNGKHFYGLKLGSAVHGLALLEEGNLRFIRRAEKFGHSVYLHCLAREGFDVPALVKLAKLFPHVSFVLGHAGIGQCDFFAVDLIENSLNIYFETSGGFTSVLRYAKDKLGSQRILYGSEFPLEEPAIEIKKIEYLGIEKELLAKNADFLLKGKLK